MEYQIASAATYVGLIKEVNKFLAQGFTPLGGLSISDQFCAQAMVKSEEQVPPPLPK